MELVDRLEDIDNNEPTIMAQSSIAIDHVVDLVNSLEDVNNNELVGLPIAKDPKNKPIDGFSLFFSPHGCMF